MRYLVSWSIAVIASVASPLSPQGLSQNLRFVSDPCQTLCEEFSSHRRGNGFDLCDDPRQSACVPYNAFGLFVCSDLYWSTSEDGSPGLVYAVGNTLLVEAELSHPLTCAEADNLVFGDTEYDYVLNRTRIIELSVEIFTHLSPVRQLIDSRNASNDPLIDVFRRNRHGRPSIRELEKILRMDHNEIHEIMDVFEQLAHLSRAGDTIQTGLASHRRCSSCGMASVAYQPILLPVHPMDEVNGTVPLENLLGGATNTFFSMMSFCDACNRHTSTEELRRIIQQGDVYVILIDPFFAGNVSYPPQLNMSMFAGAEVSGNPIFQLVAFADRRNDIGLLVNRTWLRSGPGTQFHDSGFGSDSPIVSQTLTAVFYQQSNTL